MQYGHVIVGRNPCYRPGKISGTDQSSLIAANTILDAVGELLDLKAVHVEELLERLPTEQRQAARQFFDRQQCAIVLSSQGIKEDDLRTPQHDGRSIADVMQGGDYDGDKATVIWDPAFTEGFKEYPLSTYTKFKFTNPHAVGSTRIRDVLPTTGSTDRSAIDMVSDAVFNWFCVVIEEILPQGLVGRVSNLHENWAFVAAGNWHSVEGDVCEQLGDLACGVLDVVTAGYDIEIPRKFNQVDRSARRRRTNPDSKVMTVAKEMYWVCVMDLAKSVKAESLEATMKEGLGFNTVCEAYVPALQARETGRYGFVAFLSERERNKALKVSTIQIHGQISTIRKDTREEKCTTYSVIDKRWAAYAEFRHNILSDLGGRAFVPADPEIEDGSDPQCTQEVHRDFKQTLREMAEAYQHEDVNERMDNLKHKIRLKLTPRRGIKREMCK